MELLSGEKNVIYNWLFLEQIAPSPVVHKIFVSTELNLRKNQQNSIRNGLRVR